VFHGLISYDENVISGLAEGVVLNPLAYSEGTSRVSRDFRGEKKARQPNQIWLGKKKGVRLKASWKNGSPRFKGKAVVMKEDVARRERGGWKKGSEGRGGASIINFDVVRGGGTVGRRKRGRITAVVCPIEEKNGKKKRPAGGGGGGIEQGDKSLLISSSTQQGKYRGSQEKFRRFTAKKP